MFHCRKQQVSRCYQTQKRSLELDNEDHFILSLLFSTVTQNPEGDPETEQKQTIPSNPLSDSDFPVLGAEMKQTKDQRSKLRNETQRESRASVFREGYHAQLREVHRANMRAAEALEEDEEDFTGRRRNRALDLDMVNSLVKDVIGEIAAEGDLVTKDRVRRNEQKYSPP